MAYRFTRPLALLITSIFMSHAAMANVTVGAPAPDFTATDALSGTSVTLSDLKGKLVVLEWNNPDCPFVKKFYSVGAMQQLQQNAVKKNVVWISINSSAEGKEGYMADANAAKEAVSQRKAHPTHYVIDSAGTIGKLYSAKTTPHMFVIDTKGAVAYMGAIDDTPTADSADIATAKNYVTRALESLTTGTDIAVKSTQPYGCFVKYN